MSGTTEGLLSNETMQLEEQSGPPRVAAPAPMQHEGDVASAEEIALRRKIQQLQEQISAASAAAAGRGGGGGGGGGVFSTLAGDGARGAAVTTGVTRSPLATAGTRAANVAGGGGG